MILTQTAGAIDLADPYHDVSLPVGELVEPVPVGLRHGTAPALPTEGWARHLLYHLL